MNMLQSRRGGVVLAVWATLTAVGVRAENLVYLAKGGEPIRAKTIEWREGSQEYRVTTLDGTILPLPKAQVERLEIDKPPEFDKAAQMIGAKQFDAAIPVLNELVTKYRMLVWDNRARELLARAHLAKNEPKKAVATLEDMFVSLPKAQAPLEIHTLYWQALLAAGSPGLRKELDEAVASGSREMAAAAQIMRGDMNRAAGQKEAALLDYLRTAILFEQVKSVQPEALFKAAEMLDELRDRRAEELRKKLLQEYPGSEFAARLSGKT